MSVWEQIFGNFVLISAASSWCIAQVLKTIIDIWYNKSFSAERLWGSGGMPSAHSATVTGLFMAAGYKYGMASFEFAISFILASVVMYDAMGVRRETGKQAKLLNMMLAHDFWKTENIGSFEEKLKELVGHTPLQVLAGSILGICTATFLANFVY